MLRATASLLDAPAVLVSYIVFLDEQAPVMPQQIRPLTAPGLPLHTPYVALGVGLCHVTGSS